MMVLMRFLTAFLFLVPVFSLPPFWPEENCINAYSVGHEDIALPGEPVSSALNPFSSKFEAFRYRNGRKMAGPPLNSSSPCRILAHVGKPLSFNVYAECHDQDLDAGDVVRIFVLEDPGIPNGAQVLPDMPYQRCLATTAGPYSEGDSLGPCPMCQDSGKATFGFEAVPLSPGGELEALVANRTRQSIRHQDRVWCTDSSGPGLGVGVGDGLAEAATEHGRLGRRQFVWTPLPEQGVCAGPEASCPYVVKFQAFDAAGNASVVYAVEIHVTPAPRKHSTATTTASTPPTTTGASSRQQLGCSSSAVALTGSCGQVHKAEPAYAEGTYGLIEGAERGLETDPVTGEQHLVGLTELDPTPEWMSDGEEYPAYVYCPMEFALGVAGAQYKVAMQHTAGAPPGSSVEWRAWDRACHDGQPQLPTREWDPEAEWLGGYWRDTEGRSCRDYADLGWCAAGQVTASFPYGSVQDVAPGGWVGADAACCVCGGGERPRCAGREGEAACSEATAPAGVDFGRTRGCGWDGSRCLGRAESYAVSAGAVTSAWRVEAVPPVADRVVAVFRWTAERGMEGGSERVCFGAEDEFSMAPLPEVCVTLRVQKCRYCARVGETLKYIAEHYNHDTNWLRLWNYNPHITDPDAILRSFLPVTIGSTYRVQPGDSLSRIAARLRTTVRKILEVNPDMTGTDIDAGEELCVMPCTLNPIVGSGVHGYVPGAINGIPAGFQEPIPRFSHDPRFHDT